MRRRLDGHGIMGTVSLAAEMGRRRRKKAEGQLAAALAFDEGFDELHHFVLLVTGKSTNPLKNLPHLADRSAIFANGAVRILTQQRFGRNLENAG